MNASARTIGYLSAAGACFALACSDGTTTYTMHPNGMDDPRTTPKESVEAGLHRMGDQLVLTTDPFTLEPGEEKYMCWTGKVPEAIKVRSYAMFVVGAPTGCIKGSAPLTQ